MIAGLDSSYSRPTPDQLAAAKAAGVHIWWGYLGSRDGLGLATRWSQEDFARVQRAGLTAGAFCSGNDDPNWIRETANAWGLFAAVDVEAHIREDGPWVRPWVMQARCGLYGPMSVHYEVGEPAGRNAQFNVLAWYPGYDPKATWLDVIEARPPGPVGMQWRGTHDEFGVSVDSGWYDDWFARPTGSNKQSISGGTQMGATMGGFTIGDVIHQFETSSDGHVLWGRTVGGPGGHVHVDWWDIGNGGVEIVDMQAIPIAGDVDWIIVRIKDPDGIVQEKLLHADEPDPNRAIEWEWYQPDRHGPFGVPAGAKA